MSEDDFEEIRSSEIVGRMVISAWIFAWGAAAGWILHKWLS